MVAIMILLLSLLNEVFKLLNTLIKFGDSCGAGWLLW